jgi:penicillin-binding protein 1A
MCFLGRGARQGASTIPEQVLKLRAGNTQIKDLSERIMRAGGSLKLNFHELKVDILTEYFQHVYLGESCYGVESAARKYFKCLPSDLTPAQSFFISDRIGSPNAWRYGRLKNILRRMVIRRLLGHDFIYLPVIYGKFFGHSAEVDVSRIISQTTDVSD